MSNDVVYWLQERALRRYGATMNAAHTETQEWLWADEITRLREENARLRELLDDVFAQWDGDWPEDLVARVKAAISAERATGGL